MKQILKKNQIIISVIAIMLIAAGYMNYTSNEKQALETAVLTDSEKYAGIGDATLVSANVADNNDLLIMMKRKILIMKIMIRLRTRIKKMK